MYIHKRHITTIYNKDITIDLMQCYLPSYGTIHQSEKEHRIWRK